MFRRVSNMENDSDIAFRYLFIDLAIKNLELDQQHVKHGAFKIKEPYIEWIEKMISKAIKERRQLKKIMYQRKIEILLLHRQGDFSTYKVVSNRGEKQVTLINHMIKKNVGEIIKELIGLGIY